MLRKALQLALVACAVGMLSACAASGRANSDNIVSVNGQACNINAAAICQQARNGPTTSTGTGITGDRQYTDQNTPMTMTVVTSHQVPGGSLLQVECQINTRTRAVIYAHYEPGPTLTKADMDFLRSNGLCKSK